MTREMNKPDWHNEWIKKYDWSEIRKLQKVDCQIEVKGDWVKSTQRILNPDIADFFWTTCERYSK